MNEEPIEKLYAFSIAARKGDSFWHVPGTLVATSDDEATGKAYKACLHRFKSEEGYYNHSISVMEIKGAKVIQIKEEGDQPHE